MKLYKLTRPDFTTYNDTLWGENVEHTAPGGVLCTSDVLHAYNSADEAVFFDQIHGNFGSNAVLWEAEGDICVDDCTKIGCTRLRTLRTIPFPLISTEKRVEIAIRCALLVYNEVRFVEWASKWLSGEDRSEKVSASWASWAASWASWAARAAEAASWAAEAAEAAEAASASWAASARAAEAASWAARATDKNKIRNVIQKVCLPIGDLE